MEIPNEVRELVEGIIAIGIIVGYPYAVLTNSLGVSSYLAMVGGISIVFNVFLFRENKYLEKTVKFYVDKTRRENE